VKSRTGAAGVVSDGLLRSVAVIGACTEDVEARTIGVTDFSVVATVGGVVTPTVLTFPFEVPLVFSDIVW